MCRSAGLGKKYGIFSFVSFVYVACTGPQAYVWTLW
jgi:hypothetical protein